MQASLCGPAGLLLHLTHSGLELSPDESDELGAGVDVIGVDDFEQRFGFFTYHCTSEPGRQSR